MSRGDLDQIQLQLKSAIQSHQLLVAKMKINPQDMGLKKQLHNIQREIIEMSEKQKLVVQRLKAELVERQPSNIPQNNTISKPIQPVATHAVPHAHQNLSHQPTDLSKKTPQSTESKSGISQPKPRSDIENNPPKTASPPLRVPEYPRNRPSMLGSNTSYKPQVTSSGVSKSQVLSAGPTLSAKRSYSETAVYRDIRRSVKEKHVTPEEKRKLEFMATIDLVTPDTLKEMQGRRTERKRRSTYNPNFTYGMEWERRRIPAFIAAALNEPKKSRGKAEITEDKGRPRASPSPNTSRASTPDSGENTPVTENGPAEKLPKVHDNLCAECNTGGHLLLCDTCTHVYHLQCVSPPLDIPPEGHWSCPKCQSANKKSAESLAAVDAFVSTKTAKEEEKRRLLKRSAELLQEKTDLQNRTQQLNDILAQQGIKKQELIDINKKAQQSVENLKNFVKMVQSS